MPPRSPGRKCPKNNENQGRNAGFRRFPCRNPPPVGKNSLPPRQPTRPNFPPSIPFPQASDYTAAALDGAGGKPLDLRSTIASADEFCRTAKGHPGPRPPFQIAARGGRAGLRSDVIQNGELHDHLAALQGGLISRLGLVQFCQVVVRSALVRLEVWVAMLVPSCVAAVLAVSRWIEGPHWRQCRKQCGSHRWSGWGCRWRRWRRCCRKSGSVAAKSNRGTNPRRNGCPRAVLPSRCPCCWRREPARKPPGRRRWGFGTHRCCPGK